MDVRVGIKKAEGQRIDCFYFFYKNTFYKNSYTYHINIFVQLLAGGGQWGGALIAEGGPGE